MANRYWVGGTASWDGTAGTKWALTSGGAGGQAVPTTADDVFFDAASGVVTVTVSALANAKNITFTGFSGTFTGTALLLCYGNLTLSPGMTWTYSGTLQLNDACLLTSAGKSFVTISTNTANSNVVLQDALTLSGALTISLGTFTTNNFNVTASSLSSSITYTRTINLGSSTVTLSGSGANVWGTSTTTGLTFNSGTSSVVFSNPASSITLAAGGLTFYNVSASGASTGQWAITGANTFNNLSVTAPASAGVRQVTFDSRQTINGTLSTTGTAGNRRVWFSGLTYGIAQTLTINSAPSLTDTDFRDLYVIGSAAPISGTRIGDLRGIRGITASTPKTVYWSLVGGGNWSATAWAATSGGSPSTDNFPLAQDVAVIENTGLNTSSAVTFDSALINISSVSASTRTNAMTFVFAANITAYGNWTNGSGVTTSAAAIITCSGRNTQTITSAGKTFSSDITVDSYGGSVELADALNIGTKNLTVTNGTFDTKNFSVTAGSLYSNNSNVRAITLGSSTLTISDGFGTAIITNLTFNAGTSQFNFSNSLATVSGNSGEATGLTFYNVSFTSTSTNGTPTLTGANTFNNLTVTAPASVGINSLILSANQTITGTLTVSGNTAVRRIFVRSDTLGTQRDLTVGTLVAGNCDFRDIEILGTAAGSSPTRAGDCGGNTGITFPAPKTVYWNLGGAANWGASTGWAASSGGAPAVNNFPLAQDTAVFDNTGSAGTVTMDAAWNIGTFDASARTSAITLAATASVYGDWKFGTGVTTTSVAAVVTFSKRGTQTITSNGVTFNGPITIDNFTGTVQLADALTLNSARTLTLTNGLFDAVTYNVTVGLFASSGAGQNGITKTLKMGSGTWTLSGTGTVFNADFSTSAALYKGTANIVLSDTSTTARTFTATGSGVSYNKLTIGGSTGTSTLTFTGTSGSQFTEIASIKTVAHTIAFPTAAFTFGAWTVTGTVGNVVTVTGTPTITIAGARVSGVNYLAMGTATVDSLSPGEFYAGVNSTGSGTGVILTAAPTPVTRYWRGGTGTWDATTTTNWSATSGGAGGVSVPTSADAVIFDSASNATAYTVTCTATQLRTGSLTFAGPASGNVTWAGSAPIAMHGNVTLPATGMTRSYTGAITLTGSATGRTITTNGVSVVSPVTVNGVGCGWSLGSAWISASSFTITNGAFDTANYALTGAFVSFGLNTRSITLGSSTITSTVTPIDFGSTESVRAALTFNCGTSTITTSSSASGFNGNNQTFYDVSFTNTSAGTVTISGTNTFNNLLFTGITVAGLKNVSVFSNQTINGTLTLSAGTNATMRTFVRSDVIGTTRTLTCAAFSGTDADFRDIIIAGAAAPVSGTRLGDAKGNSGITFDAGVPKYWNLAGNQNWSATAWALSSGGSPSVNNFPLAQDTAIFESTSPATGATTTINATYNIGTIDMSARTSNTMTLATGTTTPAIYGNWINGTGTTLGGTGALTFAGQGSQTLTSAGRTFTQDIRIDTPSGSVTLQDTFVSNAASSGALTVAGGTFNANSFNVTFTDTNVQLNFSSTSKTRTVAVGSGTWTIASGNAGAWNVANPTNLTVTGTGTLSLTGAVAKTFAGGSISYSGITLNQGGAGTLTITGNNTFANITNTYSATGATIINMGTTTQTVAAFTAKGEAGRVLTVKGSSAASPATLVLTTGTVTTPDYLAITGVRAYNLNTTWYAGTNSVNNGSLGWIFPAAFALATGNFFMLF